MHVPTIDKKAYTNITTCRRRSYECQRNNYFLGNAMLANTITEKNAGVGKDFRAGDKQFE